MTKLIGMIGGVSWESTVLYYQLINQSIRERLGGLNSAKIIIHSLNYGPIVEQEREGKWDIVANILIKTAKSLEQAGCDFIILGCNTLHKVSEQIENAIEIPFINITDSAAIALRHAGITKIGLLGTQFTLEEGFYTNRLQEKFGLAVEIPPLHDRKALNNIIYDELCVGKVLDTSRHLLSNIMKSLIKKGVQGILLACTELGMLVQKNDAPVPIFDTTLLHANSVVDLYLK